MPLRVHLTRSAENDLEDIIDYIAARDAPRKALRLLERFEGLFASLQDSPKRGNHPKELAALGISEYRELHIKPYRIFYRYTEQDVYIVLITDGRRNMGALLERRLLSS